MLLLFLFVCLLMSKLAIKFFIVAVIAIPVEFFLLFLSQVHFVSGAAVVQCFHGGKNQMNVENKVTHLSSERKFEHLRCVAYSSRARIMSEDSSNQSRLPFFNLF